MGGAGQVTLHDHTSTPAAGSYSAGEEGGTGFIIPAPGAASAVVGPFDTEEERAGVIPLILDQLLQQVVILLKIKGEQGRSPSLILRLLLQ